MPPPERALRPVTRPSEAQRAGTVPVDALIEEQFAHTIAHDLRSPLTTIQMCAETLSMSDDVSLRQRYASIIAEQARAIAWSLENLVTLADDPACRGHEWGAFSLNDALVGCLDELESMAQAREITVVREIPPYAVRISGYQSGIRLALRGCAQVMVALVPAHHELTAAIRGPQDAAGDASIVTVSLLAHSAQESGHDRLAALNMPWHRLSLLSAARLIDEHGGLLTEIREQGTIGLQMTLPSGEA